MTADSVKGAGTTAGGGGRKLKGLHLEAHYSRLRCDWKPILSERKLSKLFGRPFDLFWAAFSSNF